MVTKTRDKTNFRTNIHILNRTSVNYTEQSVNLSACFGHFFPFRKKEKKKVMLTFFMQPTAAHGISCFYPSHSDSQSDYHNIFQDVHTVKRRKQLPFPNVSSHIPSAPAWLN